MPFEKASLKKTLDIDEEGYAEESVNIAFKYRVLRGEKYEDVRAALIQQVDKQFNEMFGRELSLMPERMTEGEQWYQRSLFANDAIREGVEMLRKHGAVLHVPGSDDADGYSGDE